MDTTDCIVIGAGVVGLACARALAREGNEVVILEAERLIGHHASSRNTGCIHAGINYRPGSLKSRLARRGKALLYAYCAERDIPHRRCGKLITAVDAEGAERLPALKARAEANDLLDLHFLSKAETRAMEPELAFHTVLHSPSSGIVDPGALMLSLLGEAEDHGASLALDTPVLGGGPVPGGLALSVGGKAPMQLAARIVVNAAGFGAQAISRRIEGVLPDSIPGQVLQKATYFVLNGARPFSRLIYPLPDEHDEAVHLSPDLSGTIRFGPDSEPCDTIDYSLDEGRAPFFYRAGRRFWPSLPDGALSPGWAAVRSKTGTGRASDNDFMIQSQQDHGVAGLITLYGIESPGLTSSLAIAEAVCRIARHGGMETVPQEHATG